jgi:mRNA-degrading endonuclease toxin of MazEF toxin-antitoxin module
MARKIVKRGSIVLVRYPFTDLTDVKVRSAIVITPDSLLPILEDVMCVFISLVIPIKPLPTDIILETKDPSFAKNRLEISLSS